MNRPLALVLLLVGSACATPSASEEEESETGEESGDDEGAQWVRVHQADESQGALMSVWGTSADELWVVGGQPDGQGTVLHWDGLGFAPESIPAEAAMLNWVYGVEGRVWAVGVGGTILVRDAGVWSSEVSPSDRTLWGIWGEDAQTLWAVGGDGVGDQPLILRRDGASETWSAVELPSLAVDAHGLFKIWGTSASDVWVVGDLGASLHFDGSSWTDHSTDDNIDLISLWGSPAEGIVGVGGRANGRVVRLVEGSWVGETLAAPGLNGVWVDPSGPITMVGNMGTILELEPGTFTTTTIESPTPLVLHAVFGFPGGPRWAVGGTLLGPTPWTGVIVEAK